MVLANMFAMLAVSAAIAAAMYIQQDQCTATKDGGEAYYSNVAAMPLNDAFLLTDMLSLRSRAQLPNRTTSTSHPAVLYGLLGAVPSDEDADAFDVGDAVEKLQTFGAVVFPNLLATLAPSMMRYVKAHLQELSAKEDINDIRDAVLGGIDETDHRYDTPLELKGSALIFFATLANKLKPLFDKYLGEEGRIVEMSAITAFPQAGSQRRHSDTRNEENVSLLITCFVALSDIGAGQSGALEAWPGSHLEYRDENASSAIFSVSEGTTYCYDSRLWHRGTGVAKDKPPRIAAYLSIMSASNEAPQGTTYSLLSEYDGQLTTTKLAALQNAEDVPGVVRKEPTFGRFCAGLLYENPPEGVVEEPVCSGFDYLPGRGYDVAFHYGTDGVLLKVNGKAVGESSQKLDVKIENGTLSISKCQDGSFPFKGKVSKVAIADGSGDTVFLGHNAPSGAGTAHGITLRSDYIGFTVSVRAEPDSNINDPASFFFVLASDSGKDECHGDRAIAMMYGTSREEAMFGKDLVKALEMLKTDLKVM